MRIRDFVDAAFILWILGNVLVALAAQEARSICLINIVAGAVVLWIIRQSRR